MIYRQYNSPVSQERVKHCLFGIRVEDFVAEGQETSVALAYVYRMIQKLSRKGPDFHRVDAHHTAFLRRAVI